MAMKFEKLASKFIKPLVTTPQSLKNYKIGFIDELAPFMNVAVILFFTKNSEHDPAKFVVQLEISLEKRLYPLAGRYVEESQTVHCNDEGVEFIEAKVSIKLEHILGPEVNIRLVDEFIPTKGKRHDVVLTIQLTTFECGGVALDVCATHKVVDASTLCTFLNEWAAMNREENEIKFTGPGFISSSLFPACGVRSTPMPIITDDYFLSKYTTKKVSFSESAISSMRAKAITNGNTSARRFSKLQLVSATIWKALIGVDRVTHDYVRESVLCQPINLREKMASSIPKYSCGNLWGVCSMKSTILGTIEELINLVNDSVKKIIDDFSKVHHNSEQGKTMVLNSFLHMTNIYESTNPILLTSWCKFPFYEADFGFGKPAWAVPWMTPFKNLVLLIDDVRGNGVEAYIILEVKDVPYFEQGLDADVLTA
ncbi:vinorine synthase-like [Bidens hawaiensis]|uniref:vinorine synthase-like n=1 Tax=Bidens hawaiensis TaxID=980011 RepID=UPI00404AAF00